MDKTYEISSIGWRTEKDTTWSAHDLPYLFPVTISHPTNLVLEKEKLLCLWRVEVQAQGFTMQSTEQRKVSNLPTGQTYHDTDIQALECTLELRSENVSL